MNGIHSVDELRKLTVRAILRNHPASFLLRHALCMPWVGTQSLDEMAWTDYKRLYFNFIKINSRLQIRAPELDPGEVTNIYYAVAGHEILHNLWLHRQRGEQKDNLQAWKLACEWAINYYLFVNVFQDVKIVDHLGIEFPETAVMSEMRSRCLPYTTEGFYTLLEKTENPKITGLLRNSIPCTACQRPSVEPADPEEERHESLRRLVHADDSMPDKEDVLRYITNCNEQPSQRMPWEMLLLGGFEDAVDKEQSWAKPSRRNEEFPGWRHEKYLTFVWILDVSPSIDDDMKRSFVNTLQAGINLYHDAIHRVIFFADGILQDITLSSGADLSNMEIPSGDGTCLQEVWRVLERDKPDHALVLTDLELYEVPEPSHTKIIWGIVGNYRMFDPDYGIKIELK